MDTSLHYQPKYSFVLKFSNSPHYSAYKLFSITRAPIVIPRRNLESIWPLHKNQWEKPQLSHLLSFFLPKRIVLENIPRSYAERATCKYRRHYEDNITMRIISHWCTVFASFGERRKPNEEQPWSPGNPTWSKHWYSGWNGRPVPGGRIFQVHLGLTLPNSFPRKCCCRRENSVLYRV